MSFENKLKGIELFNEKIERIRLSHQYNEILREWEVEFLKQATNHGQQAAKYQIPHGSGKGLDFHLKKVMLCDLYNSMILIKF